MRGQRLEANSGKHSGIPQSGSHFNQMVHAVESVQTRGNSIEDGFPAVARRTLSRIKRHDFVFDAETAPRQVLGATFDREFQSLTVRPEQNSDNPLHLKQMSSHGSPGSVER